MKPDGIGDALPNFGLPVSLSATTVMAALTAVTCRFERYISSYVKDCPFHLFDTRRQRNISRSELKDDISTVLMSWIKCPLTPAEVMGIISSTLPSGWKVELEQIRPYVLSAMAKSPLHEDELRFISVLNGELQAYHSMRRKSIGTPTPPIPIHSVLLAVRELIEKKRNTHTPITRNHVFDQISLCGQYAILSHRWYQDNEELSFVDVPNLSHPTVQAKKGYQKLVGFQKIVQSYYGCRYLWVDSACISETDRKASIPLMFAWYRHAYVCVIYLTSSSTISKDPWSTRGWTLQELLAAERIICFTSDWRPVKDYSQGTPLFHACREDDTSRRVISLVLNECLNVTGRVARPSFAIKQY